MADASYSTIERKRRNFAPLFRLMVPRLQFRISLISRVFFGRGKRGTWSVRLTNRYATVLTGNGFYARASSAAFFRSIKRSRVTESTPVTRALPAEERDGSNC